MKLVWTAALVAAVVGAAPGVVMAEDEAQTPTIIDVGLGVSAPYMTLQLRGGSHGCWHDYLVWGAHVTLASTYTDVNLNGDGRDDFSPREDGPNIGVNLEAGLPLYWRLDASLVQLTQDGKFAGVGHVGELDQISLIGGARVALGESHPAALALGLRAMRSSVLPAGLRHYYKEHWVQLRGLWFAPGQRFGVNGQVGWMPFRRIALVLYGELMPRLGQVYAPDRRCHGTYPVCTANYPISIFNPRAEQPYAQLGVRLQMVAR